MIGEELPINWTDASADALRDQVREIETSLLAVHLSPFGLTGLQRTFFRIPDEPQTWMLGGRFDALGPDNYQSARPQQRAGMTIDGDPVVEIDIVACGLGILYGLAGVFLDPDTDPYAIPKLPRVIAKAWIVEAFGPAGLPERWPRRTARALGMKHEGQLEHRRSIANVRARVLDRHPILRAPAPDWARIQNIESSILVDALDALVCRNDVPALPVHDSLIVRETDADFAAEVLSRSFERHVGARPMLRRGSLDG